MIGFFSTLASLHGDITYFVYYVYAYKTEKNLHDPQRHKYGPITIILCNLSPYPK